VLPGFIRESGAEVFAAVFGWGIAPNDEFLGSRQFDLDPGAAAPAGIIDRVWPLCDQAFELELPSHLEQFFSAAL